MDGGPGGIFDHAEIHEAFYRGNGKDYAAEAELIAQQVFARNPGAVSLLDAACGTGLHLKHFTKWFDDVAGFDLTEDMVRLAGKHVPDVPVHLDDMRQLQLDRKFDAITCLFNSVGYLANPEELDQTIACFVRHLRPGGVIIIEPWWSPDTFLPGYVGGGVVQVDGRTITRISHSVRVGAGSSRVDERYIVADPASGLYDFPDSHVLALFDQEQYELAFKRAGCSVMHVEYERVGPGLFVGVREDG